MFVRGVLGWLLILLSPWLAIAEAPRIEIVSSVPPLTIESIYHPAEKFKYLESATPPIRWFEGGAGQDDTLLVKREGGWMQVNPADAVETPFEIEKQLVAQIVSLDETAGKVAESVVRTWIGNQDQSLDARIVRIGESLALVGLAVQPRWVSRQTKSWRECSLSPDRRSVAFVDANDLYVLQLAGGQVNRITQDGSPTLLNGLLDWVYQEEIFGRGNYRAYWWRDDSRAIAFLKIDTSAVKPFTVTASRGPRGETLVERYPKAGDPIPRASVWCVTLGSQGISAPQAIARTGDDETIITRVGWNKQNGELWVQQANRLQNEISLSATNTQRMSRRSIFNEQSDRWLEVHELPEPLPGGDLLRLSDLSGGRRRLWRMPINGEAAIALTPNDFDVRELVSVSKAGDVAYLLGDQQRGTAGQHLYQVDLQTPAPLVRITGEAPWHTVSISKDCKSWIDRPSSLTQPTAMWLRRLDEAEQSTPRLINQERLTLANLPSEISWPSIQTPDGVTLPAWLLQPQSASSSQPCPVLIEIYGGPMISTVRDGWSSTRFLFHQMLARNGIAVLAVDNRSSGGRGLADSWSIHRRMGEVETNDLIAVADWLGQRPWADANRLALRGWSFGGFLTLHAMTHSDRFAVGVAGGSVTDWRNYDAFYTERFMGLPAQNQAGYDATSPVLAASKMHGRVLLLHGEIDDNVHYANTLQMARALQKAGKMFDLMVYPGAGHGIQDPSQDYHLMKTTFEFLLREFGLKAVE